MKSLPYAAMALLITLATLRVDPSVAKKSSSSHTSVATGGGGGGRKYAPGKPPPRSSKSSSSQAASSRRGATTPRRRPPPVEEEEEDNYEEDDVLGEERDEEDIDNDEYADNADDNEEAFEDEEEEAPRRSTASSASNRRSASAASSTSTRTAKAKRGPPPPKSRYEDEEWDEEDEEIPDRRRRPPPPSASGRGAQPPPPRRGPPPPGSRRGPPPPGDRRGGPGAGRVGARPGGGGSVVPYGRGRGPPNSPGAFSSVIAGIRSAVPDTDAVKNAALSSIKAARETTSSISTNLYREVKGLTSSELEQVMLKATRPDDTAVKGKHVERLVGVTYQISSRYDIYDAVLRKLWSKMAEKDWRTTIKALYILHRFSADGAPDHAAALKARLRELRRTRDPKRKDKFFNTKQLMAGDATPENGKYRAFMQRYAHFVLLRAQCFGGMFDEIGTLPKADKKKGAKPITSTSLRAEHLEAAGLLLKAGVACQLKDGEECENTAIAAERVAADLIGLTTAVAIALNRALKDDDLRGANPALLKKWCQFYADDLQPQTRAMVKKTSPKLDAYGLFLPSRMGTSVSRELLDKGLNLEEAADDAKPSEDSNETGEAVDDAGEVASAVRGQEKRSDELKAVEVNDSTEKKAASEVPKATDEDAVDEGAEVDEEYEYEEEDYYDDEEE